MFFCSIVFTFRDCFEAPESPEAPEAPDSPASQPPNA
jgi:hypothetical protein